MGRDTHASVDDAPGRPPTAEPRAGEARLRALLEAVVAVGGDLDLHATLERIVESAAHLAGARYVALGVLNEEGQGLSDFITYGISEAEREKIGSLPRGRGILGLIITEPRPIRLADLRHHPGSFGFPENHPPMTSFLGVPVRVGDRIFGNLYLTEKIGAEEFTEEDEKAVVALAAAAGVAVENASLYERLQRRQAWLTATSEIQQALLGTVDRAAALELITDCACEIAGTDLAVVVLEEDDGQLRVEAVRGGELDVTGSTMLREGPLAEVIDRGATAHLVDELSIPGLGTAGTSLLVPFIGPAGAGGALIVAMRERRPWVPAEDEVDALRGFAAQTAIALDRAQAEIDRADLAVLADRDRIARDLHDLVIQRLFATGLALQGAVRLAVRPEVSERLHTAIADLDATIRDIRGAIFELSHAGSADLRGQLREVVNASKPTLDARVELVLEGPLDTMVPEEVRPHLLAVLVEALSNVSRHAKASHVVVRVAVESARSDGTVVAEIRDDGVGLTELHRESGLRNMRERAEELGGAFALESEKGQGCTLRWQVPLSRG